MLAVPPSGMLAVTIVPLSGMLAVTIAPPSGMLAVTIVPPSGMLAMTTVLHLASRWHSANNSLNIFQESTQQGYFYASYLCYKTVVAYLYCLIHYGICYHCDDATLFGQWPSCLISSQYQYTPCGIHVQLAVCSVHATSIMSCIYNFLKKRLGKVIELLRYQNPITMAD